MPVNTLRDKAFIAGRAPVEAQWRRVKVSVFGALVSDVPPEWVWRHEWNLMRVTRRGVGQRSDWLEYAEENNGFRIKLT